MIVVINKRHNSHAQLMENERKIYVGRPSALGNPFEINEWCGREESIELYLVWFRNKIQNGDGRVLKALNEIKNWHEEGLIVYLECYCSPLICHADIIRNYIIALGEDNDNNGIERCV